MADSAAKPEAGDAAPQLEAEAAKESAPADVVKKGVVRLAPLLQALELGDIEKPLRRPPQIGMIAGFLGCAVASYVTLNLLLRVWRPIPGVLPLPDPIRRSTECGMIAFGCAFVMFTCSLICRTDKEKRTSAFLVCYINAIAFSTNLLLYFRATPVLVDYFGRPCFPIRHVQWLHTTPAMIFMAAKISSFTPSQVLVAVLWDVAMLVTGLASSLASSWPLMAIYMALSCGTFLAVLVLIWNMFRSALKEARDLASYRNLQFLQAHMVFTWNIFPLAWFLAAADIITPEMEAYMYLVGDLSAKVIFSALLLEGSFLSIEERRRAAALAAEKTSKNALIAELRAAVTQKDRFLASVSHELRTPLNGIIGLSDSVMQGSCGPVNDSLSHTLDTIKKSGHRLQNLVNDILDVSSARNGKLVLRYDRVKLRPVVDHVLDLTSPMLKWSVKLFNDVASTLPEVECDQARIIQVLHNLVGNAAKFTDEGEIRVSARLRKNETGQDIVAVTVQDTGIGVPDEKLSVIFNAFEQVSEVITQQRGGTGLGLSLAETLVRAHHGSISVSSTLGGGSDFTFVLPLVQPKREASSSESPYGDRRPTPLHLGDVSPREAAAGASGSVPPSPRLNRTSATKFHRQSASGFSLKEQINQQCASNDFEDSAGRKVRSFFDVHGQYEILSVDDDAVNQMVVEGMLRPKAYKITKKMDGMEALSYLEHSDTTPDLILLDVMMPGLSGYEVCRQIRAKFPASALPVIMVSAKSQEGDIVEGLKAGANDYLTKPFKRLEILARIETQLKIKKLWRVEMEAAKSYQLLKKMLPESIIDRLNSGQSLIADSHNEVTILFSDIVGFTEIAGSSRTADLIFMLNDMFTGFDELVDKHGVYKVETIGDAYMVVAGHDGAPDHACRVIRFAMDMLELVGAIKQPNKKESVRIRIGIHSGPAYAGVIGVKCPRYCFFGDTVNTASRMESNGYAMAVHCSPATHALTQQLFDFAPVGRRHIKGKGPMETYLLKHGEWELALRALKSADPPPLERAGSVPILTDLDKPPQELLLAASIGRRSRVEVELQAAKALERTGSAPPQLESPEESPGAKGTSGVVPDTATGEQPGEETPKEDAKAGGESDGASEPERKRSASSPLPAQFGKPAVTDVSPVTLQEELPISSRRARFENLRINPPGTTNHSSSTRVRSPLSRSYSSPDLKVLISQESLRASYSSSPSSSDLSDDSARALCASAPTGPKTPGRSSSFGSTRETSPLGETSDSSRRASDGNTKRSGENPIVRFVQVGKTAWVLRRPSPRSSSDSPASEETPGGTPKRSSENSGSASSRSSEPPGERSVRLQHLRNMLGSDPGSYVCRLSDISLLSDTESDPGPRAASKSPLGGSDGVASGGKSTAAGAAQIKSNGRSEAQGPQRSDARVGEGNPEGRTNKSTEVRARMDAIAAARPGGIPLQLQLLAADGAPLSPTSSRQYSRVSRTELVCLAANSCGFGDNNSAANALVQSKGSWAIDGAGLSEALRMKLASAGEGASEGLKPQELERAKKSEEIGLSFPRRVRRSSPLRPRQESPVADNTNASTATGEETESGEDGVERLEEPRALESDNGMENGNVDENEMRICADEAPFDKSEDGKLEGAFERPDLRVDDAAGVPSEHSPSWYKNFAPPPLEVTAESAKARSRQSFSQPIQERGSSPKRVTPENGKTYLPVLREEGVFTSNPASSVDARVTSPVGSPTNQNRSRVLDRAPVSPLSFQARAAAKSPSQSPPKMTLPEGVELDPVTVRRLTEHITEQVLSQLGSPLSSQSSFSSNPGSPAYGVPRRTLSLSPVRRVGWGPWKADSLAVTEENCPRGRSSGTPSPGGSRSPRGRLAFTEPIPFEDNRANAYPIPETASTFPGRPAASSVPRGRPVSVSPWLLEMTRSHSVDGLANLRQSIDAGARPPLEGLEIWAADVDRNANRGIFRSESCSGFEWAHPSGGEGGRGRAATGSFEKGRDGEIARFLTKLGLEHYADTLEQEEVTMRVLSTMTSEQLKEVGILHLGARLRILEAFEARNLH